ncbi:MAG: glycosyltransferase [Sphingomonadaceae bacterium]|nr:glycosyltransferase [Sphingomonadaceae bacterium]
MAVRILHCHSTFAAGGKEARATRLMNALGDAARHVVLSAVPGALGARDLIEKGIAVEFPQAAPPLTGKPSLERYRALAGYMRRFDLVLTYNWGAIDAVMARRMFAKELPPLIHHEDGFNADEAGGLKTRRNLFRRLALPAAHALVVPSAALERIALRVWKQPARRVHRIANGVDVSAYGEPPRPVPGFRKQRGDIVIGTLAGLRAVKNLPRLVRAVAPIPNAKLLILGEGPERAAIAAEAARLGMAKRLIMPGFVADPAKVLGHFDIFALSSDSEQAPISLIEAMAAGLPVAATDVGDIAAMLPAGQRAFVGADLPGALMRLAGDGVLRRTLGDANRAVAKTQYNEADMIAAYKALYEGAAGRPGALGDS